ncbi:MAG: hypothetical protein LBP62_04790 [Clostridiales bacterium]|nr:hypothetical protein [Clostridiales bacterium]
MGGDQRGGANPLIILTFPSVGGVRGWGGRLIPLPRRGIVIPIRIVLNYKLGGS